MGATLFAGYTTFINGNFLGGVAFTFDIFGKKTKEKLDESYGDNGIGKAEYKSGGFSPTIALKLGLYSSCIGAAYYLRLGGAFVKSELKNSKNSVKVSKFVPVIGFGVEKGIGGGWLASLEADCRFRSKTTGSLKGNDIKFNPDPAVNAVQAYGGAFIDAVHTSSQTTDARLESKSFVIRFCVAHNF
ncbi:MAG: hypothetical protein LBB21_03250 [Holosporaceae bacterium]|nr:hypothetical protein [Holosporaceae bacterium]